MVRSRERFFGCAIVCVMVACGYPAAAETVETTTFQITEAPLNIFGLQFTADYLGPPEGTIVETRAELDYTAGPGVDAADIIITFQAPSKGVPIWQFTGADLGWSGEGTFKASLSTDALNGVIDLGDPPPDFSLFLFALAMQDDQPLGGQFVDSQFEVDILPADSPSPGDIDGDGDVDTADLLALLAKWGDCDDPRNCLEDIDGDGSVGTADLLELLANWG